MARKLIKTLKKISVGLHTGTLTQENAIHGSLSKTHINSLTTNSVTSIAHTVQQMPKEVLLIKFLLYKGSGLNKYIFR